METSLFRFIWKYSKKDQLVLLAITILTFPVLYVSLELPKRIINDAIGGVWQDVVWFGITLTQVQFLLLLCFGFLLAVLVNGLLKMRLNTMKGVLAERLLRRFRFQLLTRILRFPRPYFRTTSQGELVSMVTSESEPLGGLMGDMVSQPVFQAGQMMTILVFLFAQSVWFGLASVALIPLQAWIIPRLQRQINLLNKERIQEVRALATDIGETASGVSDIRTNGGLRYRSALFSNRLGNLFGIRFEIYQKKFFMKFLNNFINQLTPFFFYSVGGYLAITGEITVGALVAALAAYKDLSSPWKELLTYYNLTQDNALRWQVVTERFAPKTLVDDALFDGVPDEITSLQGDIEFHDVTVHDEEGHPVLEDITMSVPRGARVGIKTASETEAAAFADVLTREVIPRRGAVRVAGHELNALHQVVVGSRIGYAHSRPHIFGGTLGQNLLMPLQQEPAGNIDVTDEMARRQRESERSGNSVDPFEIDWIAPDIAGLDSPDAIREWWFQLIEAMGTDEFLVRRTLHQVLEPGTQPELEKAIVRLRPEIAERLARAEVDDVIAVFDPDEFNAASPLGSNLLFAHPTRMLTQETLAKESKFLQMLKNSGIEEEIADIAAGVIDGLTATFGADGIDHPLFRRLGIEDELYHRLGKIVVKRRELGNEGLPPEDFALLITVPFSLSAEQIGPTFSQELKERVLTIRKQSAASMVAELGGLFKTLDPQRYIPVMTVLGNAIFGRISNVAGAREKRIEDVVVEVLTEHGLRRLAAQSIYDLGTVEGGTNLPSLLKERVAFSRAGIKKPDILILNNALASLDGDDRELIHERLGELMPDATLFFIEKQFHNPDNYDLLVEIENRRIDGGAITVEPQDSDARQDLQRKLRVLAQAELFANLDLKQQRLLAFSSQWYEVQAGQTIFAADQEADAAYLCVEGLAGLYWSLPEGERRLISEIAPGRLIGDLAVITNSPRQLDLTAIEDSTFLRIGASELLAVIEHDVTVATSLLRAVSGHLNNVAETLHSTRTFAAERGVDFAELDKAEDN